MDLVRHSAETAIDVSTPCLMIIVGKRTTSLRSTSNSSPYPLLLSTSDVSDGPAVMDPT